MQKKKKKKKACFSRTERLGPAALELDEPLFPGVMPLGKGT